MEFYPASGPVLQEKQTSRLRLHPLRATDVEFDYEAIMSSAEMLHRWSQTFNGQGNVGVARMHRIRIAKPKMQKRENLILWALRFISFREPEIHSL